MKFPNLFEQKIVVLYRKFPKNVQKIMQVRTKFQNFSQSEFEYFLFGLFVDIFVGISLELHLLLFKNNLFFGILFKFWVRLRSFPLTFLTRIYKIKSNKKSGFEKLYNSDFKIHFMNYSNLEPLYFIETFLYHIDYVLWTVNHLFDWLQQQLFDTAPAGVISIL